MPGFQAVLFFETVSLWSSGWPGTRSIDHSGLELIMIPPDSCLKCEFTFNSEEERQEMGAVSGLCGSAVEASHVEAPGQWAGVSVGTLQSRNPGTRRATVLGLGG